MTERETILSVWLGELLYERGETHDWMAIEEIDQKINAIYVLLDIDKRTKRFAESMKDCIEIVNEKSKP